MEQTKSQILNVLYNPNSELTPTWKINLFNPMCVFYTNPYRLPLTHYLQLVKSKQYTYGKHIVPHDATVHEYSTGLSRVEVARNHGVPFTIAPDIGLVEGIDAVRNILNRCWFDEVKCGLGIKALENYKKNGMIGTAVGQAVHSTNLLVMEQMLLECYR